jgi:hypothetical protein
MELVKETARYYERCQNMEVFHSYFSIHQQPIFRYIGNTESDTYLSFDNKNLLLGAEDPRPFVLNKNRCVLTQRYTGCFKNVEQYIVNIDSNEITRYMVNEPDFFYGKNWSPFVYNDELYIIHGFDPFILIKNNTVVAKIYTDLPKQVENSFCQYRGGTNGIQINNTIIGVGHRTFDYHNHVPFIWLLDMENKTILIADMLYNNRFSLADPTSLWVENDQLYLSIFESSKRWNYDNLHVTSLIFKLDTSKLKDLMTNVHVYKLE